MGSPSHRDVQSKPGLLKVARQAIATEQLGLVGHPQVDQPPESLRLLSEISEGIFLTLIRITRYSLISKPMGRHFYIKGHNYEPLRAQSIPPRSRRPGRHRLRGAGFATECGSDAAHTSIRERRREGVEINRCT